MGKANETLDRWNAEYDAELKRYRAAGCFIEEADKWAREAANYRVGHIDDVLRAVDDELDGEGGGE